MVIEISVYDNDIPRARAIENNLYKAMTSLGLKGTVKIISEPPLLSRENLLNKVPVLEILENYWCLKPQCEITEQQCSELLSHLFIGK